MRSSISIALIAGVLAIAFGEEALADRMGCPPGENCEASTAEKIRRSVRDADFVVLGSFQAAPHGSMLEPLQDGTAFTDVILRIDEVLQGQLSTDPFELKLNAWMVPPGNPGKARCEPCSGEPRTDDNALVLSEELKRLERSLEGGQLPMAQYQAKVAETRLKILTSPNYLYKAFVLVPIHRVSRDVPYRIATVPLEFGKQYVLMVFRRALERASGKLFGHDLDLYPTTELSAVRSAIAVASEDGRSR